MSETDLIKRVLAGSPWLPMRTVPRDGTPVLLGLNYKGMSIIFADQWSEEHGCWVDWASVSHIPPTFWMPLNGMEVPR